MKLTNTPDFVRASVVLGGPRTKKNKRKTNSMERYENWTQITAPVTNWVTVASSADGRTLIVAGGGASSLGHLYLSMDSEATWKSSGAS